VAISNTCLSLSLLCLGNRNRLDIYSFFCMRKTENLYHLSKLDRLSHFFVWMIAMEEICFDLFSNGGTAKITQKYFLICVSILIWRISVPYFSFLRLFLIVLWTSVYILQLILYDTFFLFQDKRIQSELDSGRGKAKSAPICWIFSSHPPDAINNIEVQGCLGCYLLDILIHCWVHPSLDIVYRLFPYSLSFR
jgi:hypothetical protein